MTAFSTTICIMGLFGIENAIFACNIRRYNGEIPLFPAIGMLGSMIVGLTQFVFFVASLFCSSVPWYCPVLGYLCWLVGAACIAPIVIGVIVGGNLFLDSILKVLAIPGFIATVVWAISVFR